jgi:membrane-bound lytic murein transglycosylase D
MKAIARVNRLNRRYTIVAGQTLKIPTRYYSRSSGGSSAKSGGAGAPKTVKHVVKAGDSLWVLARRYGTTVNNIKDINGLSNSNLHIGQVLRISAGDPGTGGGRSKYMVRRGDSPFSIAKRHNMSLKRFLKINSLNSRSKIYPGQVCYVE